MKRLLSLVLVLVLLLAGCGTDSPSLNKDAVSSSASETTGNGVDASALSNFTELNDPALLQYVEKSVYQNLIDDLDTGGYFIENVSTTFVSKEYLEELAYNSQSNIFFGYSLDELNTMYQGTKYVFTINDNGQTTIQEFEKYDDTYDKVLRNVAIGTGVILVCITVSVVSVGVGASAVSMIFAASAKSGTAFALSSGVFSSVATAIVTGIQTKDLDKTIKATALAGSEGFMWGAISGSLIGGVSEGVALHGATLKGLTMNEAATIQRESRYSLDIIKNMSSMKEYELYKKAGLTADVVNGNPALLQAIDLKYESELAGKTVTNLERMMNGYPPIDPTTKAAYELHHVGQAVDSPLAILTAEQHRFGENNGILHDPNIESGTGVHAILTDAQWAKQRSEFWKAFCQTIK